MTEFTLGYCNLVPGAAAQPTVDFPGLVSSEFRRLHWPSAELVLQPPDHRTLVNLATIFSTPAVGVQSQTVTLLGQSVTIEAAPTSWVWHAGDGSVWTTADPGAAYGQGVDVSGLNTHTYEAAAGVEASVDVVYTGRYRVGGGGWTAIPDTLTVGGPAVALTVLEAKGLLTGR